MPGAKNGLRDQVQALIGSCRALAAAGYQLAAWFEAESKDCWSVKRADKCRDGELQCRRAFRALTCFSRDLDNCRDSAGVLEYLKSQSRPLRKYALVFRELAQDHPKCFLPLCTTSECLGKLDDHLQNSLSRARKHGAGD
jgi:hypothetical protein